MNNQDRYLKIERAIRKRVQAKLKRRHQGRNQQSHYKIKEA
jgi:hypothetical protein